MRTDPKRVQEAGGMGILMLGVLSILVVVRGGVFGVFQTPKQNITSVCKYMNQCWVLRHP